jgi:hypothetical protein
MPISPVKNADGPLPRFNPSAVRADLALREPLASRSKACFPEISKDGWKHKALQKDTPAVNISPHRTGMVHRIRASAPSSPCPTTATRCAKPMWLTQIRIQDPAARAVP